MNIERILLAVIAASCLAVAVRAWTWPVPVTLGELQTAGEKQDGSHEKAMQRVPFVWGHLR